MKKIDGIIKSLLYSDRPATPKNIKFPVFKEILLSDKRDEIFDVKNSDMRKLLLSYQNEIEQDSSLKPVAEYLAIIDGIQEKRLEKVLNGNTEKVVHNRMKKMYENKEIEEIKKDRGVRRFSLWNGFIDILITTWPELEYEINMLQLDAMYNIATTYEAIHSSDLIKWYNHIEKTAKNTYGKPPVIERSKIIAGENQLKSEEYLLYYCLTNGKIYCIHRTKLKI